MQQTQPLETPAQPAAAQIWPEGLRDQPRPPDPFPRRLFVSWLIPGLVGAIILIAITIYLEQRANRRIVYLTPGGALASVRADGAGERALTFTGLENAMFGPPQWAPDGSRFAVVVSQRGTSRVLVAQSGNITPTLIETGEPGEVSFAGDPWSADGAYLSLVRARPGDTASLSIADVRQARVVTVGLVLDPRANLGWRRQANELLVTARVEGITPTLHIVGVDGQARPITLQDKQVSHSDGAWSPDGQQIAYVASAKTQELAGAIWVATSDGGNAREIVQEGQNFAPVWAPRGDLLYFTRLLTKTGGFELYRVRLDGQGLSRIGTGTPAWHTPGVDRSALLAWSPDGSQLFFQDFAPEQKRLTIYKGLYDGSNAQAVFVESNSGDAFEVVRWAPTSRALLIDSQSRGMFMLWVDAERPIKRFPTGSFPSWQP
jgi:dipeptidyl aminopeptidase/acylaminoacyl peptidase